MRLEPDERMEAIREEYEDSGTVDPQDLGYIFDYIQALELAIDFATGEEETCLPSLETSQPYYLQSYVEEGLEPLN